MNRLRRLLTAIEFWCLNPRCPWCRHRTSNIEAHMRLVHAGDRVEDWRP